MGNAMNAIPPALASNHAEYHEACPGEPRDSKGFTEARYPGYRPVRCQKGGEFFLAAWGAPSAAITDCGDPKCCGQVKA